MGKLWVKYILGISISLTLVSQAQFHSYNAQRVLDRAVQRTPAIAIVLDAETGRVIAEAHLERAIRSAPGSVLKPFFLMEALRRKFIYPQTTVKCNRALHIDGRNVDCTHPQNQIVFDAEQALAYSCNGYFAALATRFTPEEAVAVVEGYDVPKPSILRTPADVQQLQLFVLGLEGISITPLQLAQSYRKLTHEFANMPSTSPMYSVVHGLEDSVTYGMAHNAYVNGLPIAGKTGTASNPGQPWTHGWFAGYAPANHPKVVISVYLPRGNGADAAHLAQLFFSEYKGALVP
jgi:cell division protein FtsI/penicillin-binding protein 2